MIIIGLGNPGKDYERTRHNVGFAAVDALAAALRAPAWKEKKALHALIAETRHGEEKVVLAKPTTFMNASGDAARALLQYFGAQPQDLWVLHDEVDLPLGTTREAYDRGAAGHRGVTSVMEALETKAFHRIRFGIAGEGRGNRDTDAYVLSRFTDDETVQIQEAITRVVERFSQ